MMDESVESSDSACREAVGVQDCCVDPSSQYLSGHACTLELLCSVHFLSL